MRSNTYLYRAFISYSQRDQHHAKRLHSALERYRVPKGIDAPLQPNRRLGRFFRDNDEMGASIDLGGALRHALENSENLIVICSLNAVRSKWVNEEISYFNSSGGDRIFAVIVDGTPNSDDPETNCFPPALRSEVGNEKRLVEPLAVDLRKESFSRARLRLVAGLLGISFDSLWQRDKRRTLKTRAIATSVTLAVVFVIGLLGFRWLTERGRVHAQRIDRTLVTVRDDLASERVTAALEELERLHADGETGDVETVLKTTLSWVSTPAELLKEIEPPAFVSNGSQFFFLAANGSLRLLNIYQPHRRVTTLEGSWSVNVLQPYRRILSSDKRWLLILGDEEAIVLDVSDGREVARTTSSQIKGNGAAFETGGGLLIVAVGYSSEGSFLVFSPERQTLEVFTPYLAGESQSQYRSIVPLYVSSDCKTFGIVSTDFPFENSVDPSPSPTDMFFLSADANSLKPVTRPTSMADWRPVALFDPEEDQSRLRRSEIGGPATYETGCGAPAGDSKDRDLQQGVTGLIKPIGLSTFWESERRWKVIGDAEPSPNRFDDKPAQDAGPCTEQNPCTIQDADRDKVFTGDLDAVDITRPRGVPENDHSFDRVNDELVYAFFTHFNAGFLTAWCRKLDANTVCLRSATGAELFEDQTERDLRSNTGRFIFYSQGEQKGFRLYDLLTMRNVTPPGRELVASTNWVDFSPDDKRLFLAINRRLLMFAPPADGNGPWQQISDSRAVNIPALLGSSEGDKVVGLLALDDNNLIVVHSSGIISRFDWRTGQQLWTRTIGNVGWMNRLVVSRNRRFLLVIGRSGARLMDTKDGLVLSGVLLPSPARDGKVEILQCFSKTFVADTGAVDVSCGDKVYRREPDTFAGDAVSRLKQILSNESLVGSNQ
jgi:hypothetical protein